MYNESEVKEASLVYFNGDELATNVFMTKYCLRDNKGNFMEKTPDDMHRRIASEMARIEKKFIGPSLTEEEVFEYLENFKYIVNPNTNEKHLIDSEEGQKLFAIYQKLKK